MTGMHSETVESLTVLWTVGIICCSIGIIFLYRALASKGSRATNVAESRASVFPMWLGRTLSILLGLAGVASGLGIIIRILKE